MICLAHLEAGTDAESGSFQRRRQQYVSAGGDDFFVGCAGLECYGEIAPLRSAAVTPEFQGKGIGRALLVQLLQNARQHGINQLFVRTTTAADYFARYGFVHTRLADAPTALYASAELRGACPTAAALMVVTI